MCAEVIFFEVAVVEFMCGVVVWEFEVEDVLGGFDF